MPSYEKLLAAAGEQLVTAGVERELAFRLKQPDADVDVAAHTQIAHDVRKRVQALLHPWFSLPKPPELAKLVDEMRVAASRLNVGADQSGASMVPASDVRADLDHLHTALAELDGAAITAFRTRYADPLPAVVAAHCSLAAFLGSVLVGEQQIFAAVRHDVLSVVRRATAAMQVGVSGAAPAGGAAQGPLRITASGLGAGGVFAGGDAAGSGATSPLLGSFAALLPATATDTPSAPFGTGRWFTILSETEKALAGLGDAIESREKALDDACGAAHSLISSQRAAFDLEAPSDVLEVVDPARLGVSGSAKEIKMDLHTLRKIGDELMPAVAESYLSAVQHSEHAVQSSAWSRDAKIGLGPHGAYAGWKKLNDELLTLLRDTRHEVQRAGNHLMIAGRLVDETDEQVRSELKEHRNRGTRLVLEGEVVPTPR